MSERMTSVINENVAELAGQGVRCRRKSFTAAAAAQRSTQYSVNVSDAVFTLIALRVSGAALNSI